MRNTAKETEGYEKPMDKHAMNKRTNDDDWCIWTFGDRITIMHACTINRDLWIHECTIDLNRKIESFVYRTNARRKGRFQRMFYDVERVLNSLGQMIDLTRLPFLNALRSLVKCNYRTITDYPRKRPSGFPFWARPLK